MNEIGDGRGREGRIERRRGRVHKNNKRDRSVCVYRYLYVCVYVSVFVCVYVHVCDRDRDRKRPREKKGETGEVARQEKE